MRLFNFSCGYGIFALMLGAVLRGQTQPSAAIELEKMTVEERGLGRAYFFAAVQGFELLSPFSKAQTEAYARELQRQQAMLSAFIPELAVSPYDAPQAIFMDDQPPAPTGNVPIEGRSHMRAEGVLVQSLAAIRGVPSKPWKGQITPSRAIISWSRALAPDGLIIYTSVYGFDYVRQTGNGVSSADRGLSFIFPLPVAYAHRRPNWPAWLEAGIDALVPRFYSAQTLQFFLPAGLKPPPLGLEIEDVFAVGHDDAGRPAREVLRQAAEIFVGWALCGDDNMVMRGSDERRDAFWRFARRACTERVTETMFVEHFGADAWSNMMRWWIRNTAPTARKRSGMVNFGTYWPEKNPAFPPVPVRPATRAELVRVKSEYEWRIGRDLADTLPDLSRQCLDQAGRRLRWAYNAGEREPRFLAVLALYEADAGSPADARARVEEAVATGVVRPQLYLQQARHRHADEQAKLAGPDKKLTAEQVRHVLQPLLVARSQRPRLVEVYGEMTSAWIGASVQPEPDDLALLVEGVGYFPRSLPLCHNVALLHLKAGDHATAIKVLRRVLPHAAESAPLRPYLVKLLKLAEATASAKTERLP